MARPRKTDDGIIRYEVRCKVWEGLKRNEPPEERMFKSFRHKLTVNK